jgi:hypothetical protein
MARQVRPWLAHPAPDEAPRVRVSDRGANQQIPSGTAAKSRNQSPDVRVQSLPSSSHELRAWQTGASMYVWARHLDGRLSGGHHDAHGNCEGPTALAGADRHRASAVVHAPASSALAMRSGDSEPARRSTAAQRLGGEPVVSVLRWQVSRDAGATRRFCC